MDVRSYRDLKVWQMGMDLACQVYAVTTPFPKAEVYGLTSQIQRAAVSVPSNIAEGHARDSSREFLHFISISLGSVAEVETQLLLAERLQYVEKSAVEPVLLKLDEIGRMLRAMQRSLKAKCAGGSP